MSEEEQYPQYKFKCPSCRDEVIFWNYLPDPIPELCNRCQWTPLEQELYAAIKSYPTGTTMTKIAADLSLRYGVDEVRLYHWPRGGLYLAGTFK